MNTMQEPDNHPCFNEKARHSYARIHLPVARSCNIQCKYCNRKYDCINESRPGVTSAVLSPGQAVTYLQEMKEKIPRLAVAGIAGPGDPFAEPELTMDTLRRISEAFPGLLLCIATNGFNILPYIPGFAEFNVSHVTITVNAIDPAIGGEIYSWVRDGKRIRRGKDGAAELIERQLSAIVKLKEKGIIVKINTIIIPGINDSHIPAVAKSVSLAGADVLNCIPLYPAAGTEFTDIIPPSLQCVSEILLKVRQYMPLMTHCTRCRADAAGLLGSPLNDDYIRCLRKNTALPLDPADHRPYVAVASREGVLVNQHLGEAGELWIFREKNGNRELVEKRKTPAPGSGAERWMKLSAILDDCRVLLASGAGRSPTAVMEKHGIKVMLMEGLIDEGLRVVFHGGNFEKLQVPWKGCHTSCSGNGQGCG